MQREEEEDLAVINLVEYLQSTVSMFMPLVGLGEIKLKVKDGKLNYPGEATILMQYFPESATLKFGKTQKVKPETIIVDTEAFCYYIEYLGLLTEGEIWALLLQINMSEIRSIYRIKTNLAKNQLLDMTIVAKLKELKAVDLAEEIEANLGNIFKLTDITEDELLYEIDAIIISVLCMKSLRGKSVENDQIMVADFLMLTKPEFMASPKSWLALI
jgi:hypothetical protein